MLIEILSISIETVLIYYISYIVLMLYNLTCTLSLLRRQIRSKEIGLVFLMPFCVFLTTFKTPSPIGHLIGISQNLYVL